MSRTIVITGASSGIGANAAGRLSRSGWDVAVVGRNRERTYRIADEIGGEPFLADYDELEQVRALAAELDARYPVIDVLANNAGGLIHTRGLSRDGHERTLQHNHLAPFLLTSLLMPKLEASRARVIGTASVANTFGSLRLDDLEWQKRPWSGGWRAYGTSKIATILFTQELARRTSLTAYSFHPGYVATSFGAESRLVKFANFVSNNSLGISAEQGATPLVHLSAEPVDVPNGTYFDGLKPFGRIQKSGLRPGVAEKLWDATVELIGVEA